MGTNQDYSNPGFAGNNITLGVTQIKRLRIKFVYSVGAIKITQNIDSQEIKLHGASILVLRAWGLHMKMIFHGDRSRLIKFWTRRKYDYIIHQYFYPEHECYTWK